MARLHHRDGLREHLTYRAGDFVYIPAGVPHLPVNTSEHEATVAVLARTAKQGGCKGIEFDPEEYGPEKVWSWASWPEARKKVKRVDTRRLTKDIDPNDVSYTVDGEYCWVSACSPTQGLLIGNFTRRRKTT